MPDEQCTAVGFVEAQGFVPVFDAVQQMAKSAVVEVGGIVSVGGGIVAVSLHGSLSQVVEAVEVGEDTIRAGHGVEASCIVFARPGRAVRAIAEDPGVVG